MVLYNTRNPYFEDLLMEHAQLLFSLKDVTTEEFKILTNPLTRFNFDWAFRKIMQQDNNTWEELALLKDLKQTIKNQEIIF